MATYTNLPLKNPSATQKFFNQYFNSKTTVNPALYEVLLAHFEKQTENVEAAQIIMAGLVQLATQNGLDLQTVADNYEKLSDSDANKYVVAVLNATRKNTSLLGYKNKSKTSPYVTRTILP